jgi:hypothetical protein
MPIIDLYYGGVDTVDKGSVDVSVTYRSSVTSPEYPVFEAVKDRKSDLKDVPGTMEIHRSGSKGSRKLWNRRRLHFPDLSVLTLTIKRKGATARDGITLSRIALIARENAPLHEMRITLPMDQFSTLSALYFTGRYDILNADEVERFNLHKSDFSVGGIENFYTDNIDDIVNVQQLEPGIRASVKTTTAKVGSGDKQVVRIRKGRRIRTKIGKARKV